MHNVVLPVGNRTCLYTRAAFFSSTGFFLFGFPTRNLSGTNREINVYTSYITYYQVGIICDRIIAGDGHFLE